MYNFLGKGPKFGRGAIIAQTLAFIVAGAIGLASVDPVLAAEPPLIVRSDMGGVLETRVAQVSKLRNTGRRIEIRGKCHSSCTLFLGLANTCVSPDARLGFHGPSSAIYGIGLPPEEFERWSRQMASHYPPALARWFMNDARYTTVGMKVLTGRDLIRMGVHRC